MDVAELLSKGFTPIELVQAEGSNITVADLESSGVSDEELAAVQAALSSTGGAIDGSTVVVLGVGCVVVVLLLVGICMLCYRRKQAADPAATCTPPKGTNAAALQRNATVKRHAVETVAMEANPMAKANAKTGNSNGNGDNANTYYSTFNDTPAQKAQREYAEVLEANTAVYSEIDGEYGIQQCDYGAPNSSSSSPYVFAFLLS